MCCRVSPLRALAVLGVILLMAFLAPSAHAADEVLPTGDRLYWDDGIGGAAARIRKALPGIRAEVARALGMPEPGPAEIHVVSGWDRIREVVGDTVPPSGPLGCVSAVASSSRFASDVSDNRALLRSLETVMRHEWIHFAWSQAAGARTRELPLWIEEGFAELIGGGMSADAGAKLDMATTFKRLVPFDKITKRWPESQHEAGLAYLQSKSWVQYFFKHQGADKFRAILADVATATPRRRRSMKRCSTMPSVHSVF